MQLQSVLVSNGTVECIHKFPRILFQLCDTVAGPEDDPCVEDDEEEESITNKSQSHSTSPWSKSRSWSESWSKTRSKRRSKSSQCHSTITSSKCKNNKSRTSKKSKSSSVSQSSSPHVIIRSKVLQQPLLEHNSHAFVWLEFLICVTMFKLDK